MARLPKAPRLVKRKRKGCATAYYYRRTLTGKDGRPHREHISLGSDLDVAKAKFAEYLLKPPPLEREPEPEHPVSVASFYRRWLREYVAAKRTPRGHRQARHHFRDHVLRNLSRKSLVDLKPADIRALAVKLEAAGVGLRTRRRVLEDLRCCLRYAVEEAEVLTRSPWKRGMLPTLPEAAPDPLNDLELAEVLRVAPERWRPVLTLMAASGLRWGEVRALTGKDVRSKPYAHLVVSRSHDGPTKSRKVREVPVMFEATDVLDTMEKPKDSGARLFAWLPETASWIRRYVIRNSWVKDFHVHRLRHTYATRYLEAGGTLEGLQRILGHSTIKLTECYGRLRPHAVAAEVARINNRVETATITATMSDAEPSEARKSL